MDDHPMTDEELMHEYAQGDAQALGLIFERYKALILNFCLRILRNRADAEDITAEVFMVLCSNKYKPQANAKFSTWLYTIARNACISRIRQKKNVFSIWVRNNREGDYKQMDVADNKMLPREEIEQKERAVAIQNALTKLPLIQKEAIVLREYQNLNYDEIAKVLNCSLAKVKILIFRAREQLRQELPSLIQEGKS